MKRSSIIIFLTVIMYGCNQRSVASKADTTTDSNSIARNDTVAASADDDPGGVSNTGVSCGDFLADYAKDLYFDSTVVVSGSAYRVQQVTDTARKMRIPNDLLFTCKNQDIYDGYVKISGVGQPSKTFVVNRGYVKNVISAESTNLAKYGVPLSVAISGIDSVKKTIELKFSFSIPYTDLGEEVDVCVDLSAFAVCKK